MSGWKPHGPLREPPRSILIVMLSAVGDAVQVLPVVSSLRRDFPETHLTWIIQPGPYELVRDHPAVDEFVLFHRGKRGSKDRGPISGIRNLIPGARGVLRAGRRLRRSAKRRPERSFDLVLCLQVYFKAGILAAMAPGQIKLGFDRSRARDLNWLFTTHRIPPHPQGFGHIQDQYFEFLEHLGVDPYPLEYGMVLSETEKQEQGEFFGSLNTPTCAMVVGSSDPRKNWTPDGYSEVASRIKESFGLQPVLVGGNSPDEDGAARAILEQCPTKVLDARGGGLRRLLWLLGGSALVIGPDTGPLHMARAMEVPVIGLYGFTNPKRSGPYRLFSELIVDGYARFPGENYPLSMERRPAGMARITPEMVMEKVGIALG